MMNRQREQLLIVLFAVQILAAGILAAILVHGVRQKPTTTVLTQGGSAVVPGPLASLAAGRPAVPGATVSAVGPTTVTTVVPGQAGRTGAAPAAVGRPRPGGGALSSAPAGAKASGDPAKGDIAPGAPIKIGAIVTQNAAINFRSSALGTKAYLDGVNAAGGIAGHKIALSLLDDQLNKETGTNQFKQLAADGIFAYAAFNAPLTEGGLKPLLESTNIPLIGSYGEYDEYHSPLAFAFTANYVHYGFAMGAQLKKLGVKTPALIYVDNNDSRANAQIEDGFAAGYGSKAAYTALKQATDTYQSDVTQMRLQGVDGLASILDPGSYGRFLDAAQGYAQQIKHVADPLYPVADVLKRSNADGAYVASDFAFIDPGDPAVKEYLDAVHEEFGTDAPVDYIGLVGWTDAKILVDALRSLNGVFTRARLLAAMESLGSSYSTGVTAPLKFGGGNRDVNTCLQIGKVSGLKVEPVSGYACDAQKA